MEILSVLASDRSLILVCTLGALFCGFSCPAKNQWWFLFYLTVSFCQVWLSCRFLIFPNEKQKGSGSGGDRMWRGAGMRGKWIRIDGMRKQSIRGQKKLHCISLNNNTRFPNSYSCVQFLAFICFSLLTSSSKLHTYILYVVYYLYSVCTFM